MKTTNRSLLAAATFLFLVGGWTPLAPAQDLGALLSPGPLSTAHAHLEGIKTCESCHEPGKGVSAKKCLSCHKPVAERMAAKTGVHREVTDECVMCHAEHAGRDADIRPLDVTDFSHFEETGFPLDGKHAEVGTDCAKCHKTRSFLTLAPECASCHRDPHAGALGATCITCHATTAAFKDSGRAFDHSTAAFQLDGAHTRVECAKCHTNNTYRGLSYGECSDCHSDTHRGALGATCAGCHIGTTAWATTNVDHNRTGFPLDGMHAKVACASCHRTGSTFVSRPKHDQCSTCHIDAHAGNFTEDCAACHTVNGFTGGAFDHTTRTEFPLQERHAEIPCVACHRKPTDRPAVAERTLDFGGLSTACESCHRDPHNGDLGTDCTSCHGTRAFQVSSFQHTSPPEFFLGKHAVADCSKCHTAVLDPDRVDSMASSRTYRGLPSTCASCHTDSHLGQLSADCADCHAVDETAFSAAFFDHGRTDFALTGQHAQIECETCHKKETGDFPSGDGTTVRYAGMSDACITCHEDPHRGELGTTCQSCHGTADFSVDSYTHRSNGEFFLGEHLGVDCESCHPDLAIPPSIDNDRKLSFPAASGNDCATCHDDVHKGTLGADCAACHTTFAPFKSASRAFHKDALMPLEGRHLAVPCAECHLNGQIEATPTTCYDCHWIRRQDDRYRTALGADCEQCHRPTSWTAVNWDHGGATGVPLAGAHAGLDCETCHTGGRFEGGPPSDCVACHLADYQGADDPDHLAAGLPTDCELCHSATSPTWRNANFDHTGFQLAGAHTVLDCAACHSSGVYQGLPSDCVDCHIADYQETDDPDHAASGFPTDCVLCHSATSPTWDDADFNHSTFQLVGTHTTLDCAECHSSGVYQGLPAECVDCHSDDHQQAVNPNHLAAGFETDCENCHQGSDPSWQDGQFPHSIYPLVASHVAQPCNACHASNVYGGLPSECVDCHLNEYREADDPDHVAGGFPTDCELCHSTTSPTWDGASFDHSTFSLVGAHTTLDCAQCHSSGVYQGLPSDCVDCHLGSYQQTTDPNHVAAGFPTDCQLCHSATSPTWDGASFDHSTFSLVGTHVTLECADCHSSGVYQGLPSDCVDCHLSDYQQTNDPDHIAAGFPTDCEICHRGSDLSWDQGNFDHLWFPINSGDHRNRECSECHPAGGNFAVFTCTTSCHPRSEVDEDHDDVQGYVYNSAACYSCHPDGQEDFGRPTRVRAYASH